MSNYDNLLLIAKDVLKKKNLKFAELWAQVCKQAKLGSDEAENLMADFYQSILESNLFFFDSKTSEWGLRENITFDAYQKMNDTFISNANDDVKESDYRSDMSQIEIEELENGNRNDKTSRLDLDAEDEEDDANINPDEDIEIDDEEE